MGRTWRGREDVPPGGEGGQSFYFLPAFFRSFALELRGPPKHVLIRGQVRGSKTPASPVLFQVQGLGQHFHPPPPSPAHTGCRLLRHALLQAARHGPRHHRQSDPPYVRRQGRQPTRPPGAAGGGEGGMSVCAPNAVKGTSLHALQGRGGAWEGEEGPACQLRSIDGEDGRAFLSGVHSWARHLKTRKAVRKHHLAPLSSSPLSLTRPPLLTCSSGLQLTFSSRHRLTSPPIFTRPRSCSATGPMSTLSTARAAPPSPTR